MAENDLGIWQSGPDPLLEPITPIGERTREQARTVREAILAAHAEQPAHIPGRRWFHPVLKISLISDGEKWQPDGLHIMGEASVVQSAAVAITGTVVLSKTIRTIAGPATIRLDGILANANSGQDRQANVQITVDGVAVGSSHRVYVRYEAGQSMGVNVGRSIPITAGDGTRNYGVQISASAAPAVVLREGRLWVEQGGLAAGAR